MFYLFISSLGDILVNITTNGTLQGMQKQMEEEGFDTEGNYKLIV